MSDSKTNTIIIGIGNSSRQDDGLGWAFLDAIEDLVSDDIPVLHRYQLNVEEAELISTYDRVIFVDARTNEHSTPFEYRPCKPKQSFEFTTHALGPEVVLSLCQSLYNAYPKADLLTITGYSWELAEGLGKQASTNLDEALDFFKKDILPALSPSAQEV
jgi:hydrogenase maturation protease